MKVFRLTYTLLILACLACVAHAEVPWGVLNKAADDTSSIYAIDNLLDNRPIRYAVDENVTPQEKEIFKANLHKWPAEVLRIIQKSGRSQQFQDILPTLKRNLTLEEVSLEDSPDIYFKVTEEVHDTWGDWSGDFNERRGSSPSTIRIAEESHGEFFDGVSLHEIGHYFGLADQYDGLHENSHREYSSEVNESCGSIMNSDEKITEDDADGFINLIDLRLAQRNGGQFSARAKKGWKSLCSKSNNIYQNARTANRPSLKMNRAHDGGDAGVFIQRYDQGKDLGLSIAHFEDFLPTFIVTPSDEVIKKDTQGRIIYVRTPLSSEVFLGASYRADHKGTIIWEKEFKYLPAYTRKSDSRQVIPVQITERMDGILSKKWNVHVASDGSLYPKEWYIYAANGQIEESGEYLRNIYLTATAYKFVAYEMEVIFKLQNRQIIEFSGTYHWESFVGHFDRDIFVSENNGQSFTRYMLPLNVNGSDVLMARFLERAQKQRENLMNFYQNFYEPLFEVKQAEVLQQIQDTLRSHR